MSENKMERFKQKLIKLQDKLHSRVEDINDQLQNKIESKIARLVTHISYDRSSTDDNYDDKDETTSQSDTKEQISIPSVVIDGTNCIMDEDPIRVCKDFLTVEKNGLLTRRCRSTSNLILDENSSLYSSSDSCLSSCDER